MYAATDSPDPADSSGGGDPSDALVAEIRRLGDRLRSMSLDSLGAAREGGASPAELAHELAQGLADAARGLGTVRGLADQDRATAAGSSMVVPYLGEMYAGDQVVVLGRELLTTCEGARESGVDEAAITATLIDAVRQCRELRLRL